MSSRYIPIQCADGFSMSVQAGGVSCCKPKNDTGPYTQVEVGYPSEPEELLGQYEDALYPGIYLKVPANTVLAIVEKHGGVVSGSLPPMVEPEEEPEGCRFSE